MSHPKVSLARPADRKRDLTDIHVLKGRLQLTDDEYRDLMSTVCSGVRSSAALDFSGRARFLEHLRLCARERGLHVQAFAPGRKLPALTARGRFIWSLWQQLAEAGHVHKRDRDALNKYVKRQTGVDQLHWLNVRQEDLVIESLKAWLARPATGSV